jgi:hypothetical protein
MELTPSCSFLFPHDVKPWNTKKRKAFEVRVLPVATILLEQGVFSSNIEVLVLLVVVKRIETNNP